MTQAQIETKLIFGGMQSHTITLPTVLIQSDLGLLILTVTKLKAIGLYCDPSVTFLTRTASERRAVDDILSSLENYHKPLGLQEALVALADTLTRAE